MKTFKLLFLLLVFSLHLTSCNKDDDGDDSEFDGSIDAIENFYTSELLDALDELGFTINTGNEPPIIDGSYLANPHILETSNIPNDNIGDTYLDIFLTFSNQNNQNLTLDFLGSESNTNIESVQSFISGTEDSFSVFLKVESTRQGHTSVLAYAISGTISNEGILNYQLALVMLEDNGDPNNNLIENNTGRLFIDGNQLCELISSRSITTNKLNNDKPNSSHASIR